MRAVTYLFSFEQRDFVRPPPPPPPSPSSPLRPPPLPLSLSRAGRRRLSRLSRPPLPAFARGEFAADEPDWIVPLSFVSRRSRRPKESPRQTTDRRRRRRTTHDWRNRRRFVRGAHYSCIYILLSFAPSPISLVRSLARTCFSRATANSLANTRRSGS